MDHEIYQSPFSWRYGSDEMRKIWSEREKRVTYRKLWVALAKVQSSYGLVTPEQVKDLESQIENVDIDRAIEIEKQIHHDLMAEIKAYAEQCPIGGGIIHLGATSADIEDNTDVLRIRKSLDLSIGKIKALLLVFASKIEEFADFPVMAYTHLQPAEPSTLGYRFAQYAQDLLMDYEDLKRLRDNLRGKGFRGAVGTGASYGELLGQDNIAKFNAALSEELELPFFDITTQTYPRKQDFQVASALTSLGGSLYKFAFDIRILQSPMFGELSEPFTSKQVGSSAMPFKRNPIKAEKIDSLGRYLAQLPRIAWDNASHSLLERTLDDSANRRIILPQAFLAVDELLEVSLRVIEGLEVNEGGIKKNFDRFGPFAATERLLMALTKKGADRQEMHERIRNHSMIAWKEIQAKGHNPLIDLLAEDEAILSYLSATQIDNTLNAHEYLGDAPQRATQLANKIRKSVSL